MKEDFSELVEYLDKKFSNIDERFSKVDERFSGVDEQFSSIKEQLFDMNERFIKIENKLDLKADKSDVENLFTAVDAYSKKADTYFQEMVMHSHKVDRHEKWLFQIAGKLGIKLEY